MGRIAAAVLLAVGIGAIALPDGPDGTHVGVPAAQAAARTAANRQWASALCTDLLAWKTELQGDAKRVGLSLQVLAPIRDALSATERMATQVDKLGLPPAAQTAQARAESDQLRADIQARVQSLESAAGGIASGNFAAIGTLLSSLGDDGAMGAEIGAELRRVVSVDLGLSLAETPACRQLAGMPF